MKEEIFNGYEDFNKNKKDFFVEEPRAFCYDISRELIEESKRKNSKNWHVQEETVNAILLLLYCWNFASRITKSLTKKQIRTLLKQSTMELEYLKNKTIMNFSEDDEKHIKKLYKRFKKELGQTGAAKALSLLNWELFVMWDTEIRKVLRRKWIKGIRNGETSENYLKFLYGVRRIIKEEKLEKGFKATIPIAKKIDEYHYLKIKRNK